MNILGISGGLGHDSSAALVINGELVSYAEEERFVRQKHAPCIPPVYSVLHCLNQSGMEMNEIDYIALSWDPEKVADLSLEYSLGIHPVFYKGLPEFISVDHHMSHAAAAYYTSGFNEATILTVDGQGEDAATSIYHAKGSEIDRIDAYAVDQSIGYFYTAVTSFLGLGDFGEGKLMGLAAYGEPVYEFPIELNSKGYQFTNFQNVRQLKVGNQYPMCRDKWYKYLMKLVGMKPYYEYKSNSFTGLRPQIEYEQKYKNLASSAQQAIERIIVHLAEISIAKTGCNNLIVAGGVGLNCNTNTLLEQQPWVEQLFVLPATNDGGASIGSAFKLYANLTNHNAYIRLQTPYMGSSFSNNQIKEVLHHCNLTYNYSDDIAKIAADFIANGKVIGWFQGKSEMGPRALGNRSIVADATTREQFNRVNQKIKYRESWRPLAPSILNDYKEHVLIDPSTSCYMLKTFYLNNEYVRKTPAISHIDASTRPQIVAKDDNPLWYALINEYYNKTGIPLVVNTSLNVGNEPICDTPLDCIRSFYSSNLDAIIMGNYYLVKK